MRRAALLVALVPATLALLGGPASAHPLGNFTVNIADQLVVDADGVDVLHLVDLAELPTVQLAGVWDTDGERGLSKAELTAYAADACASSLPLLTLELDGAPSPLRTVQATAEPRPGQGGLPTTLLTCRLRADTPATGRVSFRDDASEGRIGWREVTATARCGALRDADVPATSASALLSSYPEDLLASPLDVRSASFSVRPGPCSGATSGDRAAGTALPRGLGGFATSVTDFLGRPDLTVAFALLSALAAVAFGAVHALAPGHGKTVLAAYLVGQNGTRRQALQLGAVVTFTHTASVLLLGAAFALGSVASPERVIPATEVLSGLLLAAVGVYLLVLAVRRRRNDRQHDHHDHDHDHDDHHDHHGHDHDHERPALSSHGGGTAVVAPVHTHGGRTHTHELPRGPLTWRTLASMGVAGGLVPSPSALVVLLGATYLGRAWFGVVLVLLYGVGMAATLTAAGLLMLRTQAALDRRGWAVGRDGRLGRLLPLVTAGLVVVVGAILVVRGALTATALG